MTVRELAVKLEELIEDGWGGAPVCTPRDFFCHGVCDEELERVVCKDPETSGDIELPERVTLS